MSKRGALSILAAVSVACSGPSRAPSDAGRRVDAFVAPDEDAGPAPSPWAGLYDGTIDAMGVDCSSRVPLMDEPPMPFAMRVTEEEGPAGPALFVENVPCRPRLFPGLPDPTIASLQSLECDITLPSGTLARAGILDGEASLVGTELWLSYRVEITLRDGTCEEDIVQFTRGARTSP